MKMHCGEIISVANSFLKNASLPGLKGGGLFRCYRSVREQYKHYEREQE